MSIKSLCQGWISAVQFLTIIPWGGGHHTFDAHGALPWFPLCGLAMGVFVALVDKGAAFLWAPAATSLLVVLGLVALSGALHLDGLADTADGLYGRRDPQKALAIMKDSRIGAMGAVSMICCLAIKWAGLSGIHSHRFLWIMLVPAFARGTVLFGIKFLPYGRPDGTGQNFFTKPVQWHLFWGVGLIFSLSFMAGPRMVVFNSGCAVLVVSILAYYRKKMGCITGDMLGAMIEISEAFLFFILAAGDNWG